MPKPLLRNHFTSAATRNAARTGETAAAGLPTATHAAPFIHPSTGGSYPLGASCCTGGRGQPQDSALVKAFGEIGLGLFVAPCVVRDEVCRPHRVVAIGALPDMHKRFCAISTERRMPPVRAITDGTQHSVFSG